MPAGKKLRPWEDLLGVDGWSSEFDCVDKLLRHLKQQTGSEGSRATYLKTIARFVRHTGLNPDSLVSLEKADVEKRVQQFCDLARAPRTANRVMDELKIFFRFSGFREGNGCSLVLERRHVGARQRSRPEYIPSIEEITLILNAAGLNLKWRAFFLSLYTSGLRNSTLRAVRFGDVHEELDRGVVPILVKVYPEMKQVLPGACKGDVPYFSFISREAVDALKTYFSDREARRAKLEDDQILFCTDDRRRPSHERPYLPLDMTSPEKVLKRAAKAAGIKEWQHVTPHCLRKAFERIIRTAGLDLKDQEFLMGHILPGSQDTYYDKTMTEELRQEYARIEFFPHRSTSDDELRKRQVLDIVKLLGFSNEKIKRVEEALAKYEKTDDAIEEIKKLNLNPSKKQAGNERSRIHAKTRNERKKKVTIVQGESKLMKSLNEGWNLVRELSNSKFLLEKSKIGRSLTHPFLEMD